MPVKCQSQQETAALQDTPQQNKRQNICHEAVPAMNKNEMSKKEQYETGHVQSSISGMANYG
jgi:hypothetical protein